MCNRSIRALRGTKIFFSLPAVRSGVEPIAIGCLGCPASNSLEGLDLGASEVHLHCFASAGRFSHTVNSRAWRHRETSPAFSHLQKVLSLLFICRFPAFYGFLRVSRRIAAKSRVCGQFVRRWQGLEDEEVKTRRGLVESLGGRELTRHWVDDGFGAQFMTSLYWLMMLCRASSWIASSIVSTN